ncbi:hypothetical protein P43SY_000660 [Pythium insidiosum]|uniref:Uncharacterized protein n=1 Tax=Pythium insidiosum TaxID=114742 RepID=A0AAD5M6X8_PYTIN|nr:hypothetical protein P43SY_000660 [Pythium insidiosum]
MSELDGATCSHYALAPGERCREPRTTNGCSRQGCMITPIGQCESMAKYMPELDYRRNNESSLDNGHVDNRVGGWHHMFPSTNSTYCTREDPACLRCSAIARNATAANSYLASTTKFCLGETGCVCIVGCEASTWRSHVTADCGPNSPSPSPGGSSRGSSTPQPKPRVPDTKSGYETRLFIIILVVAQILLAIFIMVLRSRLSRRKQRTPAHTLRLSAWRALHQELVERDQSARERPSTSILHSAHPPSVDAAASRLTDAAPPLLTRGERALWTIQRRL